MVNKRVIIAATISLGAAGIGGCGGSGPSSEDFVGVYTMTSHRENHGQGQYISCSDAGAEVPSVSAGYSPYFALVVDPFFDDPDFLQFQRCTGPDLATCTDGFMSLMPGGPGMQYESASVSGCDLYAGLTTAVLEDTQVTITDKNWDNFTATTNCTLEAAEALRQTDDCRDVVVWIGTK